MTHEYFKELLQRSVRFTPDQVCEFLDGLNNDKTLKKWFDLWRIGEQKQVFPQIEEDNKIFLEGRDDKNWTPKGSEVPRTRNNFNSKKAEHLFQLERKNNEKNSKKIQKKKKKKKNLRMIERISSKFLYS